MARISTYNLDNTVSKNDKVIGTDSSGSSTKNFKLSDVVQFVNDSGLLNIGDLLTYQYKTTNSDGTFNLTSGGLSFSNVSELSISHNDLSSQTVKDLLDYLVGQNIIISQTDNKNNFGHFIFNSLTQIGSTSFSTMSLGHLESNGSFIQNKYYTISLSPKGQADKNFTQENINFTSNTPVTINHNLGKFPAVTVVDSAGSHIVGDIQHTNNNNFTITFKASFQGSIYAN